MCTRYNDHIISINPFLRANQKFGVNLIMLGVKETTGNVSRTMSEWEREREKEKKLYNHLFVLEKCRSRRRRHHRRAREINCMAREYVEQKNGQN